MNIKEITTKYKDGNSVDKLGIISNVVTIVTAIIALATGQILTFNFVFESTSLTILGFYLLGLSLSTLLLGFYFWSLKKISTVFDSFFVKTSLYLSSTTTQLFCNIIIWEFILSIK